MSQLSTRSSSPDLAHPILSRRQPRFYIPISEPSRSRQPSGHSMHHSHGGSSTSHPQSPFVLSPTTSGNGNVGSVSMAFGPDPSVPLSHSGSASNSGPRNSRANLAALRSALHEYSVPSPSGRATLDAEAFGRIDRSESSGAVPGVDPDSIFSHTPQQLAQQHDSHLTGATSTRRGATGGYSTPPFREHQGYSGHTHHRLDSYGDALASLGRGPPGVTTSGIPTPATTTVGIGRLAVEQMDALVEIHRVLYKGNEDSVYSGIRSWAQQGVEVKRVVERWFEGDCVRLTSRQALLTHFILLHLASTAYIPSLTPSALASYAREFGSQFIARLMNVDQMTDDLEVGIETGKGKRLHPPLSADDLKKKKLADVGDEEQLRDTKGNAGYGLGLSGQRQGQMDSKMAQEGERWWKLWDVSADCREIGCMECYDGYHIAMIEHVITLTLFPALLDRGSSEVTPNDSHSSLEGLGVGSAPRFNSNRPLPQRSFFKALIGCIASEFEYLLRWDLPISTVVEFNEVGKATHVRDVVDVRDVIDAVVPFAKRLNWITRRVTGMVTSSIGSLVMAFVPEHIARVTKPLRLPDTGKLVDIGRGLAGSRDLPHLASAIQLPSPTRTVGDPNVNMPFTMTSASTTFDPTSPGVTITTRGIGAGADGVNEIIPPPRNSLGLELASDAPDVDGGGM